MNGSLRVRLWLGMMSLAALSGAERAGAQTRADPCAGISVAVARFIGSCAQSDSVAPDTLLVRAGLNPTIHFRAVEFPIPGEPGAKLFVWTADIRFAFIESPHWDRFGMTYAGRIGWIDRTAQETPFHIDTCTALSNVFRLRSTDALLFSDRFDQSIGKVNSYFQRRWRAFLVSDSTTPLEVVLRTLRRDAGSLTGAVLTNPRLRDDRISFEWWKRFAAVNSRLAKTAFAAPSIRDNAERLVAIADAPALRYDWDFQEEVSERLRALAPSLAADPAPVSEALALHLFWASAHRPRYAAVIASLLQGKPPTSTRIVMALEAYPFYGRAGAPPMRDSLRRLGTSATAELLTALDRVQRGEMSATPLLNVLYQDIPMGTSYWGITFAMSGLDERFPNERRYAVGRLAGDSATPDTIIDLLLRSIRVRPDNQIAGWMISNRKVEQNEKWLRELAALDPTWYGTTPEVAAQLFARLTALPPPPTLPWRPRPPPRRCLARDERSDLLAATLNEAPALSESDSLCARLSAALDSLFIVPIGFDSVYAFTTSRGYSAAFPPPRSGISVTLVTFDSMFVERARRSVFIP